MVPAPAITLAGAAPATARPLYIPTRERHISLSGRYFLRSIRGGTLMAHAHRRPRIRSFAAFLAGILTLASAGAALAQSQSTICTGNGQCTTVTCDGSLICANNACTCNGKPINTGNASSTSSGGPCYGEQTVVHKNGGGKVSTKAMVDAGVFVSMDSAVCGQAVVKAPVRLLMGSVVNASRLSGQTTLTASTVNGSASIVDSTLDGSVLTGGINVTKSQISGSTLNGSSKIDNAKVIDSVITGSTSIVGRTVQNQVLTQ
jgi:hypothetical protein